MFGNPETTTGGNALKFYASVRMDIRRTGALKDGEEVIGNRTKVKIVKNKVAPPFREVEFDIMYGQGISKEGDLLDVAANEGIVEKAGAWYSYNNSKLGQGREASKEMLKTNPELMAEIRKKVLEKHGIAKADTSNIDMATGEIKEEKTPAKKTIKQ
jgi:recombination protein RecA